MFRAYIDSKDKVHVISLRKRPDQMWMATRFENGSDDDYTLYDYKVAWTKERAYQKLCKLIERT